MLKINNISFGYSENNLMFDNFSLEIKEGQFVTLMGPSGCGKTTLANIIAGYLQPIKGDIYIDNIEVSLPGRNRILINQENDLFDWMTVYENMKIITQDTVLIEKYLHLVELNNFKNYYPKNLSGGMKKRLSLARALAKDPNFIIMDEPFSSLDSRTKETIHEKLIKIIKSEGKTVLLISHDVDDAIYLSDSIVFLSGSPVLIQDKVDIQFGSSRNKEIMQSELFLQIKIKIKKEIFDSSQSAANIGA